MSGNPLKSIAWSLDNAKRTEIADLHKLDKEVLKGKADGRPGIYSLIGPNDTRAFMTIETDGNVKLWGLDYDPEYLARGFKDLTEKGKIQI